jgi:hypothetical protein
VGTENAACEESAVEGRGGLEVADSALISALLAGLEAVFRKEAGWKKQPASLIDALRRKG